MNSCGIQQNAFVARDEMWGPLVCPKPRRIGQLVALPDPSRPLRWQSSLQVDPSDLKAGVEFLDIFLTKGGEPQAEPFFCGSPPIRSANPLVNDARFGEVLPGDELQPVPLVISKVSGPGSGFAWTKFGFAPAAVRVEGFDCLDRGRSRSRGIPAVA